jgi:hypothetical protein
MYTVSPQTWTSTWESPELAQFNCCCQLSARPPVILQSALGIVDLDDLKQYALELS